MSDRDLAPKKKRRNRSSKFRVKQAQQRDRAIILRKQGLSYGEIAKEINLSRSAAFKIVDQELQRLALHTEQNMREIITLELARLDEIQSAIYSKAVVRQDVPAALACLKIMERRSRILGLDKIPMLTERDKSVDTMSDDELQAIIVSERAKLKEQLTAPATDVIVVEAVSHSASE